MKKINIFANKSQQGTLIVNNVKDNIYNDTDVSVRILDKKLKIKTRFEKDTPVFSVNIELKVFVEEVLDKEPTNNMLKRGRDFLTPALMDRLKEKTTQDMEEIISYCTENKVDLLGVYKSFNARNYKKFKKFIDKVGVEDFLSYVKFETNVKINSEI
jgi:peroxiredoxin family protein